jgi:hypothetical protein
LHATEADELELPPAPPVPPLLALLAYAISPLFRTDAAANVARTARVSSNTNNVVFISNVI